MQNFYRFSFLIFTLLLTTLAHAGEVGRSQFTTGITEREPVDEVITLSTDQNQINYFTELLDLQGHTVTHQWVYNYKVLFEKAFTVGGPRWRVWSNKTLRPGWSGNWSVNTLDQDGTVLRTQSFEYQ
jgi:hypothetical protein